MNEVLIDTLIDKVDSQERKIGDQENQIKELKQRVNSIPDNTEVVRQFIWSLQELRSDIKLLSFPEKLVRDLCARLETTIMILKQPVKKEITHHHHATKTIWIAAALFPILCLVLSGGITLITSLNFTKPMIQSTGILNYMHGHL